MLQLLPWAIGRHSGNDVVRITNAIVPGCLLPVCFPLCSYTLMMLHVYSPPTRLRILSSAFVSCQFAIAGFGFDQLSTMFYIKQSGMRTWERPRSKLWYLTPVTSSRSNNLYLSVYLSIYLSFRLSYPLFLSIHTRQQIREESNVNFSHT